MTCGAPCCNYLIQIQWRIGSWVHAGHALPMHHDHEDLCVAQLLHLCMDVLQVACGSRVESVDVDFLNPYGAAFGIADVWAGLLRGQDCGFSFL